MATAKLTRRPAANVAQRTGKKTSAKTAPKPAAAAEKTAIKRQSASTMQMTALIAEACLVTKDAAFNVREFVADSSKMALIAVKECEKELDRIERAIDEDITGAISHVNEDEARELLACLKFIIDLERIGDLAWSATKRLQGTSSNLQENDRRDLMAMAKTLEEMMLRIHQGFVERDVEAATWVLKTDSSLDGICRTLFRRHLENIDRNQREYSTTMLFVAQAFERAGDHAKNLAEELFHLVEGRSVRHESKRRKFQE